MLSALFRNYWRFWSGRRKTRSVEELTAEALHLASQLEPKPRQAYLEELAQKSGAPLQGLVEKCEELVKGRTLMERDRAEREQKGKRLR